MATFTYEALTRDGRKVAGEVEAADGDAAIRMLASDGLLPIEARPARTSARRTTAAKPSGGLLARGPGSAAITQTTRELATLLGAGQEVESSLQLLVDTSDNRRMAPVLARILERVRGGMSLSDALAEWPQHFEPMYVAMVRAGEAAGRLERALLELTRLREKSEALQRKLTSSLIYPAILFVTSLGALVLLLTVVVPRFAPLLSGMGDDLPWNSRVVLALSDNLTTAGPVILIVLLAGLLGLMQLLRMEGPTQALARTVFRLPLLGTIERDRITAQTARGLASLLEGGLDLSDALVLIRDMVSNAHAAAWLNRVAGEVRQGRHLGEALADADILSPAGLRMLRVGEESGRLREVSAHVADAFEDRTASRLTRMVALAEPLTIVVMGLLVAGIVLSILGAVMSSYEVAG